MRNLTSLMLDFSRDVSNSNEFIIANQYYDEDECSIKRIVFEIIEQNQTK